MSRNAKIFCHFLLRGGIKERNRNSIHFLFFLLWRPPWGSGSQTEARLASSSELYSASSFRKWNTRWESRQVSRTASTTENLLSLISRMSLMVISVGRTSCSNLSPNWSLILTDGGKALLYLYSDGSCNSRSTRRMFWKMICGLFYYWIIVCCILVTQTEIVFSLFQHWYSQREAINLDQKLNDWKSPLNGRGGGCQNSVIFLP